MSHFSHIGFKEETKQFSLSSFKMNSIETSLFLQPIDKLQPFFSTKKSKMEAAYNLECALNYWITNEIHQKQCIPQKMKLFPIELISIDEVTAISFKIEWIPNVKNSKLNIRIRYVLEIINLNKKNKKINCDRFLIRAKHDYYSFTYSKQCNKNKIQKFSIKIRVLPNHDDVDKYKQSDWSDEIILTKPSIHSIEKKTKIHAPQENIRMEDLCDVGANSPCNESKTINGVSLSKDGYPLRNIVTRISWPILIIYKFGNNCKISDNDKLLFSNKINEIFKNNNIQNNFGKHSKDIQIKYTISHCGNQIEIKLNYEAQVNQHKCYQIYQNNKNKYEKSLKINANDEISIEKTAPFSRLGKLVPIKAHYPISFSISNKNNKLNISNVRNDLISKLSYLEDLSQCNYGNLSQIWINKLENNKNNNNNWRVYINFVNPKAQELLLKQKTLNICNQIVKIEKRDKYIIDPLKIKSSTNTTENLKHQNAKCTTDQDEFHSLHKKELSSWSKEDIETWYENSNFNNEQIILFFKSVIKYHFTGISLMGIDNGILFSLFKITNENNQKIILNIIQKLKKEYCSK